jgi:hypothetical protein
MKEPFIETRLTITNQEFSIDFALVIAYLVHLPRANFSTGIFDG